MARPIEKRENIERGVVEVIARKGLHGTTIQDIATQAEVSPGLLYRYWRNRDDLAAEVYRHHYEVLLADVAARVGAETGFWRRIDALVGTFLEFADQKPTTLKFLLLSQHDLQPSVPAEKGVRKFLLALVQAAMASGEIRYEDPELAIHFLLGIVLQPVVGALYGNIPGPLVEQHAPIIAALRRVLSCDGHAAATEPHTDCRPDDDTPRSRTA